MTWELNAAKRFAITKPKGNREFVRMKLIATLIVCFWLSSAASGNAQDPDEQDLERARPQFPLADVARSPIAKHRPSALWFHSNRHIHFMLCFDGVLLPGFWRAAYDDDNLPLLWKFGGSVIAASHARPSDPARSKDQRTPKIPISFKCAPPDLSLSLDGKSYELADGRVFRVKENGSVRQIAVDPLPIIKDRKYIDRLARFVSQVDDLLFEDTFDHGLSDQWEIIGLRQEDYRIRNGGLEMRVQPRKQTRAAPRLQVNLPFSSDGVVIASVDVSVVDCFAEPSEFARLSLTDDGGPDFRAEKKWIDGRLVFSPGRSKFIGQPGEEGDPTKYTVTYSPAGEDDGPLRIIVRSNYAYFQVGPSKQGKYANYFHSAINDDSEDYGFCLMAGNGPEDEEHWVRFDNFRVSVER